MKRVKRTDAALRVTRTCRYSLDSSPRHDRRRARVRVVTADRAVLLVVEEPAGVGDAAQLGAGRACAQQRRHVVQVEQHADPARAVNSQVALLKFIRTVWSPDLSWCALTQNHGGMMYSYLLPTKYTFSAVSRS